MQVTAVIYLSFGGKLVFESGEEVEARPGRLVMFDADDRHAFEADGEEQRAMLGPVAAHHAR